MGAKIEAHCGKLACLVGREQTTGSAGDKLVLTSQQTRADEERRRDAAVAQLGRHRAQPVEQPVVERENGSSSGRPVARHAARQLSRRQEAIPASTKPVQMRLERPGAGNQPGRIRM
jgi:hypothetical protein